MPALQLYLIFIIMLLITRAVVASAVIVGTVLLSLGTSFGISVLIWQHIIGLHLHWMVLAMSVIILLAVGSDYNLLLVSRMKEELHGGLKTGIIRAMGGSGSVVTSAGLVFAFTMMSMLVSDLRVIGQVGSTIGLGLIIDTLVIRPDSRQYRWQRKTEVNDDSSRSRSSGAQGCGPTGLPGAVPAQQPAVAMGGR